MSGKFDDLPEARRRGLEKMEQVYGFEMNDMDGDFFGYTADHLFGEIWQRPGLSDRDRRLLLIGMLCSHGAQDVLSIQIPAAYRAGELDEDQPPRDRDHGLPLRGLACRRAAEQPGRGHHQQGEEGSRRWLRAR